MWSKTEKKSGHGMLLGMLWGGAALAFATRAWCACTCCCIGKRFIGDMVVSDHMNCDDERSESHGIFGWWR